MTRIKGLKQGLAGALALGTAAAVPLVVAGSQAQQGLVPWLPGGAGGGSAAGVDAEPAAGAADGSAAAPPDWSLSRVLEEVLQQVRQLAVGGSGADEEAGGDEEAEEGWEEEYELPAAALAADHASSVGAEAAAAAPLHAQQQQAQAQQHGGRQRRHGRDFLSARRVAAEHPEDARQLRQMTLAELARLRAEDSGSSSSSSSSSGGGKQAQRRGRQRQQQAGEAAHQQQQRQEQQEQQGQLPARFTDAELVRFAIMQGLLQAGSPAEREAKLREGAEAAARTALWLERHPFSSDEELTRFAHLVRWEGPDAAGRPVLRILIGAAVTECRGNAALAFANAILTHMEQGVSSRLYDAPPQPEVDSSSGSSAAPPLQFVISQPAESHGLSQRGIQTSSGSGSDGSTSGNCSTGSGGTGDAAGEQDVPAAALGPAAAPPPLAASPPMPSPSPSPEQLVVLMDCRGASTLNAARISWVFKAVASSLSHHYPGRLHELVLLDLPVVLGWMVKGVKQLVHPETRNKFRVVHAGPAQQAQQAQAQQQEPASGGTPGAAAAEVAPAAIVAQQGSGAAAEAAPAVKRRWPRRRRRRGQQAQHAQQQQAGQQPAQQAGQASAADLQEDAEQAAAAPTEHKQDEQLLQQEAALPRSELAAPKWPHKRGASKRKQAVEEQGQEQPGRQTEPVQQPPAAEQQLAPKPAATQPAWQRRQRGRLAEQQGGIEAGQQEAAAAAGESGK